MAAIDIPTREEIRAMIREELRGACGTYSQLDGQRPTGCGREKFLRVWRSLRAAGDEGATSEGRARILSVAAWSRFVASDQPNPRRLELVPQIESRSDRILSMLGGKRK